MKRPPLIGSQSNHQQKKFPGARTEPLDMTDGHEEFRLKLFSTILIQPPQPAIDKLLKVKDAEEYYQLVRFNDEFDLKFHQLFLNDKKIDKHIFRFRGTFGGLFFSEELVEVCKKLKMTGVDFKDASELYCSKKYIAGHYLLEI